MTAKRRVARRSEPLSRERIVGAAIDILDAEGETALTFRALAARLATGSGAIYWHVSDKDALLAESTEAIVAPVMAAGDRNTDPRAAIRAIASGLFDAIDARPWVGTQLARAPWQPAMLHIFTGIGIQFEAMDIPEQAQFDCGSALVSYILGAATQNAANARLRPPGTDRSALLEAIAAEWTEKDCATHPFVQRFAARLRDHDDREQFLAGVDLILAGIDALG
ncbi:TetR/AcrR family transcriptional regulator [Mycobacterium sp. WMMD1722]|uniref:TetR/AcrR family transcriptional regulator n=1 Tax=Mycobacterium sp. WMMD1722 TaxID=3404117 RepID=UPI003BF4CB05